MSNRLSALLLVASLLLAQGCAIRDPRDAPWDPKPAQRLFDQLPAWDGAALRECGGHLRPEQAKKEGRSIRC